MNIALKISFSGYLLVAIMLTFTGIKYLFASRIMPYHLKAMESNWDNLTFGVKVMSLNFMKVASAGFLTTSIIIFFLLFFPFQSREIWSVWALSLVSLNEVIILLSRLIDISRKTPSKHISNIILTSSMAVIIVISFMFSLWGVYHI